LLIVDTTLLQLKQFHDRLIAIQLYRNYGHVAGGGKRRTTTEEVYIKSSEVMVLKEAVEKLDYGDVVDRLKVAEGR
jgi:hypothetical protein